MKLLHTINWSAPTSRFSVKLMLGAVAVSSISVAGAQEISYTDSSPAGTLQTAPVWADGSANSLFSGTSASGNNVTVNYNGNTLSGYVYGSLVQNGTAEGNHVNINQGQVGSGVYGGYGVSNNAGSIEVKDNHVIIDRSKSIIGSANHTPKVYGGYAKRQSSSTGEIRVTGNYVTVTGEQNNGYRTDITGGAVTGDTNSGTAIVSHNHVTITGSGKGIGNIGGVHGGNSEGQTNSTLEDNHVTVKDSYVSNGITGAHIESIIVGLPITATAQNNHVTVENSDVSTDIAGDVITTLGSSNLVQSGHNTVNVTKSTVEHGDVMGDSVLALSASGSITAGSNTIVITDSDVKSDVTLASGSTSYTNGHVLGSLVYDNAYPRTSGMTVVGGNNIIVSGKSQIAGNIFGGFVSGWGNDNVTVLNNTVTLNGAGITIGQQEQACTAPGVCSPIPGKWRYGAIYGGAIGSAVAQVNDPHFSQLTQDFNKVVKGNTLNLNGYRGTVAGIYNFENYNWTLPSDVVNGDILVHIDGNHPVNLTNTKHTIADMQASDNRLQDGYVITLIDKTTGAWTASSDYTIRQGQFIIYNATLSQNNSDPNKPFELTINKVTENNGGSGGGSAAELNPQSKAYAEGRIAALGLVNQGGDLISTAGIDHIRTMVRANDEKANHPALIPFAITNGSSLRYKTGSHVDINSFNLAAGLATGLNFASGSKATVGAFFEYGHGDYDTYNRFAHFASVRGDGNSHYQGGGVFGRIDVAGTGLGHVSQLPADQADGLYAEASLRAGNVNSEFDVGRNANVLGDFTGDYRGSYNSKSTYYGGHLAGGYVLNFDDRQSLDTYARYLWTHMNSDTVSIANEPLHFDSANSQRLQIGGRYTYAYSERFKPYVGVNYEYEFDAKAKAKAYEFDLDRPTLKGSTGIFEAGFHFQPMAGNAALSVDVTGQGYVGKRQGGGGNVKVKYQF